MSLFNVNVRTLVGDILIEPVKRGLRGLIDQIDAWLAPLQDNFDELDILTDDLRKRARYSGQIIVMRAAIEDFTGISGIVINANPDLSGSFFYLEAEADEPQEFNYLFLISEATPEYFKLISEGAEPGSFIIGVPAASFNAEVEEQIRAEVDIFGLPIQDYEVIAI